jgi:hypothetical protein
MAADGLPEVVELPEPCEGGELIAAMAARMQLRLCDFQPPMYRESRLAVGPGGRLMLLAAPARGLAELPLAEQAWRWLEENRQLLSLAFAGMQINTDLPPALRLLVCADDVNLPALRPLLHQSHIGVQAYRKVRWSGRVGVLLDAA